MSNYQELKDSVAAWLDRDDLVALIPDFITIGQQEVYCKLRILEMEEISSTPLSTVSRYYDLPARFISARNVYIDTDPNTKLGYVTPEQMSLSSSSNGSPNNFASYTITDGKFKLDGISNSTSNNLVVSYYRKFVELETTGNSSTNWILENAYALFLYGAILQAEIYLYNDERIPVVRSEFERIIAELNFQAEEGRYSGSALAIRAV